MECKYDYVFPCPKHPKLRDGFCKLDCEAESMSIDSPCFLHYFALDIKSKLPSDFDYSKQKPIVEIGEEGIIVRSAPVGMYEMEVEYGQL